MTRRAAERPEVRVLRQALNRARRYQFDVILPRDDAEKLLVLLSRLDDQDAANQEKS